MNRPIIKNPIFYLGIVLLASLSACNEDDTPQAQDPVKVNELGFFIVNEGGFNNGNTSLSFFDADNKSVSNNLFAQSNDRPLGDQAQSMGIIDGKGYIVVQNSAKVEVVDTSTVINTATIDERIISPRYIIRSGNNKAYLSDWGEFGVNGYIKIINTTTATVTDSIAVGKGPNRMIQSGDMILVANSGGFGRDSAIVFINTATDKIEKKVAVGDNPNSLQEDADGNYWVAGQGYTVFGGAPDFSIDQEKSTIGFIAKINAEGKILFRANVGEKGGANPRNLEISPDKKTVYYRLSASGGGPVYKMDYQDTALPTAPFIDKNFYGLSINPSNGNLICGEAPDFSSPGNLYRYTSEGTLIDTYAVGIAPNGFTFKQ